MLSISGLTLIHVVGEGPLRTDEAARRTRTDDDYGVYQIYGTHGVTGTDTLLYVGQVNAGTFGPRIRDHEEKWGRWEATEITVYLGRLYDLEPTTDKRWGELIDRAEAVLIYKLGIAYNSSRVKNIKFWDEPILLLNHGRRHRLPECLCTITEFINTDDPDLKPFGPSGHRTSLPIPPTEPLVEEEEMRGRGHPGRRNRKRAKG